MTEFDSAGIRGLGKRKELMMTPCIVHHLPTSQFVDGELWFGRGQYGSTYHLVQSSCNLVKWHWLRMIAFDDPLAAHHSHNFEHRYTDILSSIAADHPFMQVVARAEGLVAMQLLASSVAHDGEGLVVRRAGSTYVPGRSFSLFKLKSVQGDKEGIVVQVSKEAVQLKLVNGHKLTVPKQDVLVGRVRVGDIVTFAYNINPRKIPVGIKIFKIRTDILWEDLKENVNIEGYSSQSTRYWTLKNMRMFLESFARKKGLDPLLADTWYSISSVDIRNTKGGSTVLHKYKGGYVKLVQKLFSDITFDERKFINKWHKLENVRKFFEQFARDKGLDPLNANTWYIISSSNIMQTKVAGSIFNRYKGGYFQLLQQLFSDIKFDERKFNIKGKWRNIKTLREFFIDVARDKGLDPLTPDTWYKIDTNDIIQVKGGYSILSTHKGGYFKILQKLFPHIGLDEIRFRSKGKWQSIDNVKKFFEQFARKKGMDPLIADTWYTISSADIQKSKGGYPILRKYKGYYKLLQQLFPNIQLDESKISTKRCVSP